MGTAETPSLAEIPLSRGPLLERGLLRLGPGAALLAATCVVIKSLNFTPSAVSNRITEYSLVVAVAPIALAGLALAVSGMRWAAMAAWPGPLKIVAGADALTFHLGPMGSKRYPTDSLDLRYPFELENDELQDQVFESFLPPAEQIATLLPHMRYPGEPEPIERKILRYSRQSDRQLIESLRPFIEHVRRKHLERDHLKDPG